MPRHRMTSVPTRGSRMRTPVSLGTLEFSRPRSFLPSLRRTPLTAAGTALQILSDHLDLEEKESRRELTAIALRNLKRLEQAATWCEDFLASRTLQDPVRWLEHNVHNLVTRAADVDCPSNVFLEFADAAAPRMMCGDDELFRRLVRQVLRALHYQAPGVPVALRVEVQVADQDTPSELHLLFAYCEADNSPSRIGNVARTRLTNADNSAVSELPRLLDFSVSPQLIALFKARFDVLQNQLRHDAVLKLALPVQQAEYVCDGQA